MTAVWLIARRGARRLPAYHEWLRHRCRVLFVNGILFNAFALGSQHDRLSTEVLSQFFYFSSGTTMIASVSCPCACWRKSGKPGHGSAGLVAGARAPKSCSANLPRRSSFSPS